MSLLTHVLEADTRRFRLAIALWGAVAAGAAAAQHASTLVAPFTREAELIGLAEWLFWLAGLLVSSALVPLVVQLHPAVGSDAFWMTRPVPPRTLAASKLVLLVLVFVAIPLAIDQAVMAIYRVPGADMARVAAQSFLFRTVLLMALMTAAAITPNFARFALLCGGVLFAVALLPAIVIVVERMVTGGASSFAVFVDSRGSVISFALPRPFPAAELTALAVLIAGGVAALFVQYASRRVRATMAVVASAIAVLVIVGALWPSRTRAQSPAPPWAEAPAVVQLVARASDIQPHASMPWIDGRPRWSVRIPVRMTPAAPGWLATARLRRASLELDAGNRLSTDSGGYSVTFADPDGEPAAPRALQHLLGVSSIAGGLSPSEPQESYLVLSLPADALPRSQPQRATFRGEFDVDVARLDVASTMTLGRAEYQEGAFRFAVFQVTDTPGGVIVRGRISNVVTFFDTSARPSYAYVLRNRARSEAVIGVAAHGAGHMVSPMFGVSFSSGDSTGFTAGASVVTFSAPRDEGDRRFAIDRTWLADAELVIVRASYGGTVPRTLEIQNFALTSARAGS